MVLLATRATHDFQRSTRRNIMKASLFLLYASITLMRVCNVHAAITGYFEASGCHDSGTEDLVSVSFTINGISRPLDLTLDQSYSASYTAIYTTTSDDPGFNTTDVFSGIGTVSFVDIDSDNEYRIELEFPQNPLPGAFSPHRSCLVFEKRPSDNLRGGWSADPYNFFDGILEYQPVWPRGAEILSFSRNGDITWTAPSGSVCTVEWAQTLTSSNWKHNWVDLDEIRISESEVTVGVPMFYRVLCHTNGYLQPMRIGSVLSYTASNSFDHNWTLTETVGGTLHFPDPTVMPNCANKYYMVLRSETWEDFAPEGVGFLWHAAP
jgi:hypothetical protein